MCKINLEESNLEIRSFSFYDGVIQLFKKEKNELEEELYFDRIRVYDYGAFVLTLIHEEEDVAELVIPFNYLPKAIPIKMVRNLLVDSFDTYTIGERSHICSAIEFFRNFIHGMSRYQAPENYIIEVAKYLHYALDVFISYLSIDAKQMKVILEESGETVFSYYYEKIIDRIHSLSIRDQKITFSSYGEEYTISFDSIELCFSNRSSNPIIKIIDKEGRIIKLRISGTLIEHDFPYRVLIRIWKEYTIKNVDEDYEKKRESFRPFIQGIVNLIVNNSEQMSFDYLVRASKLKHLLSEEVEEETDNTQEKKTREGLVQFSKRKIDDYEKKDPTELNVLFIEFQCSNIPQRRISLCTREAGFVLIEFDAVEIHSSSDHIVIDLSQSIGERIRLFFPLSKFRFAAYSYYIENMLNEIGQLLSDSEVEPKVKNGCDTWLLFLRKFLKELYERRNEVFEKSKLKEVTWIIDTLQSINTLEELCSQK